MDHLDPDTLQPVYKPRSKPDAKDVFRSYRKIRIVKPEQQNQNLRQHIFSGDETTAETPQNEENNGTSSSDKPED